MVSQRFEGCGRILNSFVLIESLIKRKGPLPISFALAVDLDSGLLSPEKVWASDDKAPLGVPVSDFAHKPVDSENLLEQHHAGAAARARQGNVGVKFAAVARSNGNHGIPRCNVVGSD